MGIVNEETPKKFGCNYIDEIRRNLKQFVLGDAMMCLFTFNKTN